MSTQLEHWTGDFGRAYTDRNLVDWRTRISGFRKLIPVDTSSVFEVGVNRGHNLQAIEWALDIPVAGCEPNSYARGIAERKGLQVFEESVYDLPHYLLYGLVLTSGVLIHVPSDKLDEAMTAIHKVARQYILAIEYAADEDIEVQYRGLGGMLWRRDYGAHYQRLFPELELISSGDDLEGFDGATWWLLKKP